MQIKYKYMRYAPTQHSFSVLLSVSRFKQQLETLIDVSINLLFVTQSVKSVAIKSANLVSQ